ncbi:uncharacterized, partial [Tachysurus ichikawai]
MLLHLTRHHRVCCSISPDVTEDVVAPSHQTSQGMLLLHLTRRHRGCCCSISPDVTDYVAPSHQTSQ